MKTIPDGWIRISVYDDRESKSGAGPVGRYARILAEVKRKPSSIRAYQDGKFWVGNKADIDEFLKTPDEPESDETEAVLPVAHGQYKAAVAALRGINSSISLMQATLDRLALAVESMATQPVSAHDRLVSTVESNGFHN